MRKFRRDTRGVLQFIAAVITLVGVMMSVIIGAVVFFAFADSEADLATVTYEVSDGVGADEDNYIDLTTYPGEDPQWNITKVNNTGVTSYITTGYSHVAANNTLKIDDAQLDDTNDTSATLTITYYGRAGDVKSNVVTYAVTIFALLAIIPLVMVGGLMLRSLGFMSGKQEI